MGAERVRGVLLPHATSCFTPQTEVTRIEFEYL
jgi:hypothetical protein